jgi:hypothetical protein
MAEAARAEEYRKLINKVPLQKVENKFMQEAKKCLFQFATRKAKNMVRLIELLQPKTHLEMCKKSMLDGMKKLMKSGFRGGIRGGGGGRPGTRL